MGTVQGYVQAGEAAFEQFCQAAEGVDATTFEQKAADDGWSMKDLFRHFAANTQGHVVEIRAIVDGTPGFSRENAPWNGPRDAALAAGPTAALAWMRADHEAHIGYLRGLSDDDLPKSGVSGHGPTTVERLLTHFSHHGADHAEQAREIRAATGS